MTFIISGHIYIIFYMIYTSETAICLYWVIQWYPGAVFHPRVYLI